ncbi:MAG TPA: response regulator [Caldithrix abyssi]|uniref:Response regulator n=1 Tax=Caldithrix abyssi TaxID=187145 RepID=A0A7V1PUC7_CALAY|nr:response regulator [Caldithrix abyssi]
MNRILIVDDSSMARTLIRRSLEVCGFDDLNVLEASNGVNAMEVLKNNPIDMVFTDLNMPEMDGEGLLKRIKSSPRLNHIPVVVISSKKSSATERKLIADHAVAVLAKPIVLPELNEVLEHSLSIEKN